jgi:hypothetical protein
MDVTSVGLSAAKICFGNAATVAPAATVARNDRRLMMPKRERVLSFMRFTSR